MRKKRNTTSVTSNKRYNKDGVRKWSQHLQHCSGLLRKWCLVLVATADPELREGLSGRHGDN